MKTIIVLILLIFCSIAYCVSITELNELSICWLKDSDYLIYSDEPNNNRTCAYYDVNEDGIVNLLDYYNENVFTFTIEMDQTEIIEKDLQVWAEGIDQEKTDRIKLYLDNEHIADVPFHVGSGIDGATAIETVAYVNGEHEIKLVCYNVYDRVIASKAIIVTFLNKFYNTKISDTFEPNMHFNIETNYCGFGKAKIKLMDLEFVGDWENDIVLWESVEFNPGYINVDIPDPCMPDEGMYRIKLYEIVDPNYAGPLNSMTMDSDDDDLWEYWEKISSKEPTINDNIEAVQSILNKSIAKARFKTILKERGMLINFGYELLTLYNGHCTGANIIDALGRPHTNIWIHHGHGNNMTKDVPGTYITTKDGRLYAFPGSLTPEPGDELPGKWETNGPFLSDLKVWNTQKFRYVMIDACNSAIICDYASVLGLTDTQYGLYAGWNGPVYPGNFMEGSSKWLYLYNYDLSKVHTILNAANYATTSMSNGYQTGNKFKTYGDYPQLVWLSKSY